MRLRWIGIGVVCFVWAGCSSLQPVGSPGETTTATDGTVEDCTDGVDNELDGLVDCQDDDCASVCDVDGDGHVDIALGGDDCDDNNGAVFPGNTEVCDGIDNNCDGLADDEDPNLDPSDAGWYADFDGDGFGNPNQVTYQCDPPAGAAVQNGDDCDDSDPDIHPNANEICNGQDDNCDGLTDDDDPTVDPLTMRSFWADTDADGLGDPLAGADACIPPANHVENDLDCDDTDPNVGEATEWYFDGDGDGFGAGAPQGPQCTSPGFGYVNMGEDCDDTSAVVYPGAYDLCGDGIDADCNGDDCGGCGAPFDDPSYSADVVFADTLPGTTMTLTWDGSEYWTSSGGGAGGDRLSRYDAAGALQQIYQPGYDWRAVFVKEVGVGPVYGRAFGNTQIVVMTSPGVFSNDVNLVGGVLDAQSAISFDETRREFRPAWLQGHELPTPPVVGSQAERIPSE